MCWGMSWEWVSCSNYFVIRIRSNWLPDWHMALRKKRQECGPGRGGGVQAVISLEARTCHLLRRLGVACGLN